MTVFLVGADAKESMFGQSMFALLEEEDKGI